MTTEVAVETEDMSLMYNYRLFSNFHMMVLWTASCFDGVHFEFYNNIWEWKIIE